MVHILKKCCLFVASYKEDDKNDEDGEETDANTTTTCENLVDSSLPPVDRKQQRIAELQKMKANCKSDDLEHLKTRCEILIRNCIVGLLAQLSDEDFKNMEGRTILIRNQYRDTNSFYT